LIVCDLSRINALPLEGFEPAAGRVQAVL
jgi:hypothetical protein